MRYAEYEEIETIVNVKDTNKSVLIQKSSLTTAHGRLQASYIITWLLI